MIFKKDNFVFGLILGFIAPMIGFLFYKFFKFRSFSLDEMISYLRDNPSLITVSITVSLMANAILFTIYMNGRRDKTGKGIFVLTMVYAILAMTLKYI